MRTILLLVLTLTLVVLPAVAGEVAQSDWSGGLATVEPDSGFGAGFAASSHLSWRAVPGQLSLASNPIDSPVKHLIASGHDGAYGLYVIDFDGDGDMDVLGTTDRSNQVLIWFNEGGTPTTWSEHVVDGLYRGGTSIHPVDMDADGDLDIVGAAQTPGDNLSWWRNDGGMPPTWSRFTIDGNLPVACNLFVDDIDGDGDQDVASTSWSGQFIAWWRNDGTPESWQRITIDDSFPGAHSAFAFDADGDGDKDLVGTAANAGEVVLFLNDDGAGTSWSSQLIGDGMNGVRYATAADIDGDGAIDLAATAFNGQLRWWRNGGGNPIEWSEHLVDNLCVGGHYLMTADLNGDGAIDILVTPWMLSSLYWYAQNPTDPDDWTEHIVDLSFTSPLTGFPADVDSDGDLDVVGTSPALGEIAWWEITEFVPAGSLESTIVDLDSDPGCSLAQWDAVVPAGSELVLKLRTATEPEELGEWSNGVCDPTVFVGPWQRYLQYRIEMRSDDGRVSPILRDVELSWGGGATDVDLELPPTFTSD